VVCLSDRRRTGILHFEVMGLFWVAFIAQALQGFLDSSGSETFRIVVDVFFRLMQLKLVIPFRRIIGKEELWGDVSTG
jgi:hypothetical protein